MEQPGSIPAVALAVIFVVLSGIHWYWAFGGRRGLEAAIPTRDRQPLIRPGRFLTAVVAILLLAAGAFVLWHARLISSQRPRFLRLGIYAIAAMFAARAVGDFSICGFFKSVRNTRFGRYDTVILSPLCVLVAALAIWLAIAT